jgi:hypothetical protein
MASPETDPLQETRTTEASMFGGIDLEFLPRSRHSPAHRFTQIGVAALFVVLGLIAASAGAYQ